MPASRVQGTLLQRDVQKLFGITIMESELRSDTSQKRDFRPLPKLSQPSAMRVLYSSKAFSGVSFS